MSNNQNQNKPSNAPRPTQGTEIRSGNNPPKPPTSLKPPAPGKSPK